MNPVGIRNTIDLDSSSESESKTDILNIDSDFLTIRTLVDRVYDQLGYGLSESSYRKALCSELELEYDCVEEEYGVGLDYVNRAFKTKQIATLRLDIYIDRKIVLELKTLSKNLVDSDSTKEIQQLLRYKQITSSEKGFLINFGKKEYQIFQK